MSIRIALAGNPNCGKTTLFNGLTGSNQFVGNWPGVTVEKKEGKLKKHDDVVITDLPGIYSLSPYTLEEVVARNYLIGEKPDAILNIVDGTNLERNLYLTTQLTELGIPVVIALNMMDLIEKNGDKIDQKYLEKELGCKICPISALKGTGIMEAAEAAIDAAKNGKTVPLHTFDPEVEKVLEEIEAGLPSSVAESQKRWYSVKVFERDDKALEQLNYSAEQKSKIEESIKAVESKMDNDAESIITNERYVWIEKLMKDSLKKSGAEKLTISDKIDRIVTNRWLALPIFALVMWLVYYVSVTTVGTWVTDWTNDGLFGDGFHLFGNGSAQYEEAITAYAEEKVWTPEFVDTISKAADAGVVGADEILGTIEEKDFGGFDEAFGSYSDALEEAGFPVQEHYEATLGEEAEGVPDTSEFGTWVPGVPVIVEGVLDAVGCGDFLKSLILDGIVAGVGAVLGFVPQMLVLFIFLAFLESCGYMARIAFVMDRIFRKFGLSGKSFIPMLIGTGCGVPGVMASRTIENERDRRMTIMTTTFIPCGAKLPIIALITAALFGGASWVAPSAYFLGIAAIVISGIMLKKTKMFAGDPAPFVMELPAYHWPTVGNVLRSMWERGWSFIKKAGTIILLSSIIIWAGSTFGPQGWNPDMELEESFLGIFGNAVKWIFAPLGFANIKAAIATIMGLVAKEEVVGVFGVLDFEGLTPLAGYAFLAFNLLCAPCFAAIGAIRREMNSAKWTCFAIAYQCIFAYGVALVIYQIGGLFTGNVNVIGLIAAVAVIAFIVYRLTRPYKEATKLTKEVTVA